MRCSSGSTTPESTAKPLLNAKTSQRGTNISPVGLSSASTEYNSNVTEDADDEKKAFVVRCTQGASSGSLGRGGVGKKSGISPDSPAKLLCQSGNSSSPALFTISPARNQKKKGGSKASLAAQDSNSLEKKSHLTRALSMNRVDTDEDDAYDESINDESEEE